MAKNRRLIQVYAALLYNANIKGFIKGDIYTGAVKSVCVPGLNCYSCPGAVGACPLGALQNAVAASGARAPYYVLGILMLLGLTLGRTICGWLCPFGLVQELLHKIPSPKLKKSRVTRALSYLKYVILAVFVIAIPAYFALRSYPLPAFCKYICPAGTLEGAVALLAHPANADKLPMLGALFAGKLTIMILILAACVFIYRAFCRFLCPLGAIYGLFSRLALTGVRVEAARCTSCGACVARCKTDIRRVGDRECIHCGDCIGACPTRAISFKCGKITLMGGQAAASADKPHRAHRAVAWALALLVLGGALWYFNRPTDSAPIEAVVTADDGTPTGYEVGMRCPDFTVPLFGADGGSFTLSASRGAPVVINFWATWCAPCLEEIPNFQRLADEYGIRTVMIHSNLITDDVEAYLDGTGYTLPFAWDESGSVIASLGGSTMLPMTVIADGSGTIVYNRVGSLSYERLKELVSGLI